MILRHALRWQPARFGKTRAHCACGTDCPFTETEAIAAWFDDHVTEKLSKSVLGRLLTEDFAKRLPR